MAAFTMRTRLAAADRRRLRLCGGSPAGRDVAGRHDDDGIELELKPGLFGQDQVTDVRRVEGATENSYTHGYSEQIVLAQGALAAIKYRQMSEPVKTARLLHKIPNSCMIHLYTGRIVRPYSFFRLFVFSFIS